MYSKFLKDLNIKGFKIDNVQILSSVLEELSTVTDTVQLILMKKICIKGLTTQKVVILQTKIKKLWWNYHLDFSFC